VHLRPHLLKDQIPINLSAKALGLALLTLFAASCGKVGPPQPPEILIPKPVTDLTTRQIGNEFKLMWTLPALNLNGTKATTIQRIEIYRQALSGTTDVPKSEEISKKFHGSKIMTIDMVHLTAFSEHGQMIFADKFPGVDFDRLGTSVFWYAVEVFNKKRQDAGFSNISARQWLPVPPPIPHIDFRAEETEIILTWSAPPQTEPAGLPVKGYNIYRSEQSQVRPAAPVNEEAIKETRFHDRNFQFGTTYYYTVRSVVLENKFSAESADSPEFAFKPVDVFPPKTPTHLLVVFVEGRMNLLWDPNFEPDFAGYNVYRSEDGVSFRKINDTLLKSPTFRDEKVETGKKYFYRVSAVDSSGNESQPSPFVSQTAAEVS
jgi:hypothetical protein